MGQQKKCDILLTDSPLNHKDNKVQIAQSIFGNGMKDKVEVDSISIMNSAVLSLFASGRTSGVVIESGQGLTCAVPVFEGYALPHAIKTINVSGQDVTQFLFDSLVAKGIDINETNMDNVREIKEQMCSVAMDYERAIRGPDPLDEEGRMYELPDQKGIITVDHKTRFDSTELLFNPDIAGIKSPGISQIAYESIKQCDLDLQITLYGNIVVTGGSSMIPGFCDRFEQEIFELASDTAKTDIKVDVDLPRKNSAWVGGSMLASMSTFENLTIKYSEYEENAENVKDIILRKLIF